MDKVFNCIEKLGLSKPKGEKWSSREQNIIRMDKIGLRIPKHIDGVIEEIKKNDEDSDIGSINVLYNLRSLEQFKDDKYVIAIILLFVWLENSSLNQNKDTGYQLYNYEDDNCNLQYGPIKDCYDLTIIKVVNEFYPNTFKDNSGNNNVISYDMRIKEVKFDIVYENIFGSCDKSQLKNKYQHKSQLKKKFLKGQETYENGKIDYQLVMFNRVFDLEMRNCNLT